MKICIITEGSYPYIMGGVSGWVQMLMTWLSDYSFVICAIREQKTNGSVYNYQPPANVSGVKEVCLDEALNNKGRRGIRLNIGTQEKQAILGRLLGEQTDWEVFLRFCQSPAIRSVQEFLLSKDFYDVVEAAYRQKYCGFPFADFYWTQRAMFLPLLSVIRQGVPEADLYHAVSTGYAGILGSLGRLVCQKPFILTEHGIYTREREEEIIKADWIKGGFKDLWIEYFYGLSRCAYDNADKVISLFQSNRAIQVDLGCNAHKTEVIPNGISPERYQMTAIREAGDGYVNVGAVVRVVPIKDIKTMIQGFAWAREEYEKVRFYIMGPDEEDKEYAGECRRLSENLGLQDLVFTGKVEVAEYLARMDVMVLSSISEGQPLAMLEGMACGKPYIATDVGSCRELLYGRGDNFGEAGIIVPVMNAEMLGSAIVRLCKNKELRQRMGRSAMRRVSELYSKEKLLNAYKKIYQAYEGA